MKIREVSQNLNEGPALDALKNLGQKTAQMARTGAAGVSQAAKTGAAGLGQAATQAAKSGVAKLQSLGQRLTPTGRSIAQQQKAGDAFTKGIADRAFDDWIQLMRNLQPGVDYNDMQGLNKNLEDFMNQRFHEVDASSLPLPAMKTEKDFKAARNYINQRTKEYIVQRTKPTTSDLATSYADPKVEADIEYLGHGYGYDLIGISGPGWYSDTTGRKVEKQKDVQLLNKIYHDLKASGQNPDVVKSIPTAASTAQPAAGTSRAARTAAASSSLPTATPVYSQTQPGYSSVKMNQPFINVVSPDTPAPEPGKVVPMSNRPRSTAGRSSQPMGGSLRRKVTPIKESQHVHEGGKAVEGAEPVNREDVPQVIELAKKLLPTELLQNIQLDIGSAGFKIKSGDIDLMVEAEDVVALYDTQNLADPVKTAKLMLRDHFLAQGIDSSVVGRNVETGIVYRQQSTGEKKIAQVDVMVIGEAKIVAPWHQHGPRGMYDQPGFKSNDLFILISSIAKHLGLKFDPFAAKLIRRDTGDVVGRTQKEVAKILLNPRAKESDLYSVSAILQALENDPDREGKLAQARQDASKGLIKLPETAPYNTAAYFRKISDVAK